MAKITDYPKITELSSSNVFLLDGANGTKGILAGILAKELLDLTVSDDIFAKLDSFISVELRRNLWRGKNLGSAVTSEQYNQIGAGTFHGMFLGDYWQIGGRIWRIVDFDYWWNCGDVACTTHHLVIMPDASLYNAKMNETNITTGAYVGSEMYTTNLEQAKTIVNGAFTEGHVLNHREYLQNAVTDGHASGGGWLDSTVELPNEIMMYGSYIMTPAGNGTIIPSRYTINKSQLAGMKASPKLINPHRQNNWLRDVVSVANFAYVAGTGNAYDYYASGDTGVRVVFGLKK